MPAGETQGASQVRVKLPALSVAGAMSSLKVAEIAVFVGALGVGPGIVVTGSVEITRGRVRSGATPVVKRQT